jgi:DNA-binding NarL/FixJ family response regulator
VSNPRSVLVVDDQAPFRLAARAVLRRLDGFEFAGEASSGPQAIELADTLHPSLILMDIPAEAAASGAIAYVSKEHLAADTIRELWETRTSGNFVSR